MVASLPLACFLSMITPPGVQFENSLLQIAPVDKAKCPFVKEKNDIEFQLYTRHNPTTHQPLRVDDDEALFASNIDFHDTTVIYFHAFMENPNDGSAVMVREAYILRGDTNIIMVDASRLEAGPWYFTAAENTWYIGKYAGEFVDYLVSRGLDLSRTHLVGHSLGAQAAGVAGATLISGRVARITGLDPALPLFAKLPLEQRLDPSDAEFVDVIHTDAGIFGVAEQTGHADFYPNGGISPQPGCELEVVLHEQMLLNKCDNKTALGYMTYYLKPTQKQSQSILITKIMKLFNFIHTYKTEGKINKNLKNLKKYTIPDNIRTNIKRLTDERDGIYDLLPEVDIKTPFDKSKLNNEGIKNTHTENYKDTLTPANIVFSISTPEISTESLEFNSNAHTMPSVDILAHREIQPYDYIEDFDEKFLESLNLKEIIKDDHVTEKVVDDKEDRIAEEKYEIDTKTSKETMKHDEDDQKDDVKENIGTAITDSNFKSNINPTATDLIDQSYVTDKITKEINKNVDEHENDKKLELTDVININIDSTKIEDKTMKSHVKKRQKRFVNPFRKSEAVEQENFIFRMLDFLLKHRKNIIPVFSVIREVNTLVKSANGELNHVTKERNNYIGSPPPVIPVTYSLELGNENKALAFMKRLLGFRVQGDKLTIGSVK